MNVTPAFATVAAWSRSGTFLFASHFTSEKPDDRQLRSVSNTTEPAADLEPTRMWTGKNNGAENFASGVSSGHAVGHDEWATAVDSLLHRDRGRFGEVLVALTALGGVSDDGSLCVNIRNKGERNVLQHNQDENGLQRATIYWTVAIQRQPPVARDGKVSSSSTKTEGLMMNEVSSCCQIVDVALYLTFCDLCCIAIIAPVVGSDAFAPQPNISKQDSSFGSRKSKSKMASSPFHRLVSLGSLQRRIDAASSAILRATSNPAVASSPSTVATSTPSQPSLANPSSSSQKQLTGVNPLLLAPTKPRSSIPLTAQSANGDNESEEKISGSDPNHVSDDDNYKVSEMLGKVNELILSLREVAAEDLAQSAERSAYGSSEVLRESEKDRSSGDAEVTGNESGASRRSPTVVKGGNLLRLAFFRMPTIF
jgi:hypothetical protein